MYFDPGTGSMIIQIFLAFLAGISAFFVMFKNKFKNFFKRKKNENK